MLQCGLSSGEAAFLVSGDNDLHRDQRPRPQVSSTIDTLSWGPCHGPIFTDSVVVHSLFNKDIPVEQKFGGQKPLVTKNLSGQETPSTKGHSTHNSVEMVRINFFRPA